MNADRLICGLTAVFDEPTEDGRGLVFQRSEFELFVDTGLAVPMQISHRAVIDNRGVTQFVGAARKFALLESSPPRPAGLLALAELDDSPLCRSVLAAVERGELTGLSVHVHHDPAGIAWPSEISLTHSPAFDLARIIGTGAKAASAWELLTGEVLATADGGAP